MGKRGKKVLKDEVATDSIENDYVSIKLNKIKKSAKDSDSHVENDLAPQVSNKKTKKRLQETVDNEGDNNTHVTAKKSKKSGKNKKSSIIQPQDETFQKKDDITHEKKKKKSKSNNNPDQEMCLAVSNNRKKSDGKPKHIIFENDQSLEVVPNVVNKQKDSKKTKHTLNEEDAAVKDEDIDQFCDELSEHDNEQYESWVKLIEAKMHSKNK